MTNMEAGIIFYSAIIQPLLIRYIAKDEKRVWFKVLCVVLLSIVAGLLAYVLEYGQLEADYAKIGQTILTIFALSVSFWSTAWKHVFPYKEDPLANINIDKLPKI